MVEKNVSDHNVRLCQLNNKVNKFKLFGSIV